MSSCKWQAPRGAFALPSSAGLSADVVVSPSSSHNRVLSSAEVASYPAPQPRMAAALRVLSGRSAEEQSKEFPSTLAAPHTARTSVAQMILEAVGGELDNRVRHAHSPLPLRPPPFCVHSLRLVILQQRTCAVAGCAGQSLLCLQQ